MKLFKLSIILFSALLFAASCDEEEQLPDPCDTVVCNAGEECQNGTCVDTTTAPPLVTVKTANDIPADVNMNETKTYFSLATGQIIDSADISATNWDIAFAGTSIFLNGGSSGNGTVTAQVLSATLFTELETAPTTGYVTDDESGTGLAIPTGSGNGWYSYVGPPTHKIEPIAGVVIMLKIANGNYAKMEILSYYQGNPDLSQYTVSPPVEPSRYYTIRYAVQTDGSTSLK
ncbi:MAG: HmuY family protein [Bacteroidetes bacterium]|nr:HmuY family protein [Bacteroidota bacterium]